MKEVRIDWNMERRVSDTGREDGDMVNQREQR